MYFIIFDSLWKLAAVWGKVPCVAWRGALSLCGIQYSQQTGTNEHLWTYSILNFNIVMRSSEGILSHTTVAYVCLTTCNRNQRLSITITVKFVGFRGKRNWCCCLHGYDTMKLGKWLWTFRWMNTLSPSLAYKSGWCVSKLQFAPNHTVSALQTAIWVLTSYLGASR